MPLTLPFFKFYVTDWLTSEKIAAMELPHIGAYILLLAQCWTQDQCTLPRKVETLKKLCRWNDETDGDFKPVLACFTRVGTTDRVTNTRLYAEWQKARSMTAQLKLGGRRGAEARWGPSMNHQSEMPTEVRDLLGKIGKSMP